jgi:hypothetical protein
MRDKPNKIQIAMAALFRTEITARGYPPPSEDFKMAWTQCVTVIVEHWQSASMLGKRLVYASFNIDFCQMVEKNGPVQTPDRLLVPYTDPDCIKKIADRFEEIYT